MKTGLELPDLLHRVKEIAESARDFVVDTRNISAVTGEDGISRMYIAGEDFPITDYAHRQVAETTGIPAKYYGRMQSAKDEATRALFDSNVNHWFGSKPDQRLIRVAEGDMRALLSSKYRRLDNYDLCRMVVPELTKLGAKVESCDLTESKLYLKVIFPGLQDEIGVVKGLHKFLKAGEPNVIQAGICISNSEVGDGAIHVNPMLHFLKCYNGLIVQDSSLKKYHVGRLMEEADGVREIFSEATLKAEDEAFWRKVVDVVRAAGDEVWFRATVQKVRDAMELKIADPKETMELSQRRWEFTDAENEKIFHELMRGDDFNAYGLSQAITAASQDLPDYERATRFERIGGEIIDLNAREWNALAPAAR